MRTAEVFRARYPIRRRYWIVVVWAGEMAGRDLPIHERGDVQPSDNGGRMFATHAAALTHALAAVGLAPEEER